MKKIGIIGGLGPEATVDYYNQIIRKFNKMGDDLNYPEIIIYSVNLSEFIAHMEKEEYGIVTEKFLDLIAKLKSAGADFAIMTANTPHLLFDEIQVRSELPLISIVEATLQETLKQGYKRPGLIGTKFTMGKGFYEAVFQKDGIPLVLPKENEKRFLHEKLFTEIELGIFKETTRLEMLKIVQRMINEDGIDSLILGCTEFPLILTEKSYLGIPMLNTTFIHVESIIAECLER